MYAFVLNHFGNNQDRFFSFYVYFSLKINIEVINRKNTFSDKFLKRIKPRESRLYSYMYFQMLKLIHRWSKYNISKLNWSMITLHHDRSWLPFFTI